MDDITSLAVAELERAAREMHEHADVDDYAEVYPITFLGWEAVIRMAIVRIYVLAADEAE